MPTIDEVVARAALSAPDGIAIREWDSGRRFTYREFDRAVTAFAAWLQADGLREDDSVAIHLPNCFEFLVTQFAAFRAGGVAAYVNFRLAPEEAARQMRLANAQVIVTTAEKAEFFRADAQLGSARYVVIGAGGIGGSLSDIIADGARGCIVVGGREDRDAIARFTSGSTGAPKGVLVSHRAWLIRAVSILTEEMQIVPYSATMVLGPLSHQAGLFVLPTFLRLGTMVIIDGFDVDKVAAALRSERISCTQMVPTIMHLVLENATSREALRTSGLDRLIYGGSPIRRAVLDEALALLPDTEFVQVYGSHEAGSISSLDGVGHRDPVLRNSAGRPFLAAQIRIRGDGTSGIGEIEVKAPWLPHARITEAGREALDGQWAATGDLGEYRDGYIYLRDRMNDVIISGGFNVYPLEVEAALNSHPSVRMSAVASAPDERWGERVVAFVVAKDKQAFDPQSVREHCREHLANYKVPKEIHAIPEIPVNANGKPDRRRLSQPFWEGKSRRIN